MRKRNVTIFLLFVTMLTLVACGGDEAERDGDLMEGDEVGPGMMEEEDFSEAGPDMMEDEDFSEAGPGMMEDEDFSEAGPGMMEDEGFSGAGPGMRGGTAWGDGAFESNGERIYFTGTSERSGDIDYTGGPDIGGMMMGGQLSCASCHGPNARGGQHRMQMEIMDAPNIRWEALAGHGDEGQEEGEEEHPEEEDEHAAEEGGYNLETFRMAVVGGVHPNGEPLSEEMPRWQMSDADLRDLTAYLQSLEGE